MTEKYLGGVLAAFESGAQLDLRFRLALDLMKAHAPWDGTDDRRPMRADEWAKFHLDAAGSLIAESEKRGFVLSLPDDDSLNAQFKRHIRMSVRANLYQQNVTQDIAREDSPRVVAGSVMPPAPNGRQ